MVKNNFHDEGGRGVSKKLFCMTRGGGGPESPEKDDIIYEKRLIHILLPQYSLHILNILHIALITVSCTSCS